MDGGTDSCTLRSSIGAAPAGSGLLTFVVTGGSFAADPGRRLHPQRHHPRRRAPRTPPGGTSTSPSTSTATNAHEIAITLQVPTRYDDPEHGQQHGIRDRASGSPAHLSLRALGDLHQATDGAYPVRVRLQRRTQPACRASRSRSVDGVTFGGTTTTGCTLTAGVVTCTNPTEDQAVDVTVVSACPGTADAAHRHCCSWWRLRASSATTTRPPARWCGRASTSRCRRADPHRRRPCRGGTDPLHAAHHRRATARGVDPLPSPLTRRRFAAGQHRLHPYSTPPTSAAAAAPDRRPVPSTRPIRRLTASRVSLGTPAGYDDPTPGNDPPSITLQPGVDLRWPTSTRTTSRRPTTTPAPGSTRLNRRPPGLGRVTYTLTGNATFVGADVRLAAPPAA